MKKKNLISEYLSEEHLDNIVEAIRKVEKKTSGELRLCIKSKLGYFEKQKSARELAIKEFEKLEMHKTKDRTGVLIFLMFKEHKFEIIADEGINEKTNQEQWDEISEKIKEEFKMGNYLNGILFAVGRIGEVLINEFPVKDDDKNELSDDIVFR